MTNAEIILLLVKGLTVFVASALFIRFLCDEYLRALEFRGLVRIANPARRTEGEHAGEKKTRGAGTARHSEKLR